MPLMEHARKGAHECGCSTSGFELYALKTASPFPSVDPHSGLLKLHSKPTWLNMCSGPQAKSTGKLIQSLAVFRACSLKPLVENADTIIRASRRVAAPLVDSIVKATMFRHFCGGECVESIQPTLKVIILVHECLNSWLAAHHSRGSMWATSCTPCSCGQGLQHMLHYMPRAL